MKDFRESHDFVFNGFFLLSTTFYLDFSSLLVSHKSYFIATCQSLVLFSEISCCIDYHSIRCEIVSIMMLLLFLFFLRFFLTLEFLQFPSFFPGLTPRREVKLIKGKRGVMLKARESKEISNTRT